MAYFGAFWERKIGSLFKRLDIANSGSITENDFEAIADRYITLGKDKVRGEKVRAIIHKVWSQYFAELAKAGPVTAKVYCESARKLSKEHLAEICAEIYPLFFDVIDTNSDGIIQKEEFELFYKIVGMDPATAAESFKIIDTNHDGELSREEFVDASIDFCTSDDESSPFKLFLGPLI